MYVCVPVPALSSRDSAANRRAQLLAVEQSTSKYLIDSAISLTGPRGEGNHSCLTRNGSLCQGIIKSVNF